MKAATFNKLFDRAAEFEGTPDMVLFIVTKSGVFYRGRMGEMLDDVIAIYEARVNHDAAMDGDVWIELDQIESVQFRAMN